MEPYYYAKTQLSFLRMLKPGYIYQDEHPVNFCTRCETAIAFAEVSYYDGETFLNFFDFDGIEIATTRPELLAACVGVAVNSDDERYKSIVGKTLKVPIFGHDVTIIADDAVDMAFGSGAVMICTFGDKTDVFWWKKHHLPLRKALTTKGTMTAICGKYEGMPSKECRAAILADMKELGILKDQKKIEHRVGGCWRCKTPIEILSERQWFVNVNGGEIVKAAKEIKWYPEHMLQRLENWAEQMEWDWCISRQRLFATPIPVWFCDKCGELILPDEADLPIDPTIEKPKHACPKCGGTEFTGEKDVLDTWMDSSITDLHVTGWDGSGRPPYFPAQIRPQGHDIIRTWAFYTILRSVALLGEKPWDGILINGMVLGEDGFKMSKSRDNVIGPEDVMRPYGVDALRQWAAAGSSTGQDILKSETEVIIDSTPLVASRYCPNSLFNPHYQVKMDKAHILNLGAYPFFMIHSEGTENDKPYAHFLIQIAELLGVSCDRVLMDAGYDSLELHTLIFEKFHAKPLIQLRSDAQLSQLGSEKTIIKQINTFWRKGGNAQMSLTEKLVFLCKNGKREMVGAYLRNQTILHGREVKDAMKRRERANASIHTSKKRQI